MRDEQCQSSRVPRWRPLRTASRTPYSLVLHCIVSLIACRFPVVCAGIGRPSRPKSRPRSPPRRSLAAEGVRGTRFFAGAAGRRQGPRQPVRPGRRRLQVRLRVRSLRQHGRRGAGVAAGRQGRTDPQPEGPRPRPPIPDHLLQRAAGDLQSQRHARPAGLRHRGEQAAGGAIPRFDRRRGGHGPRRGPAPGHPSAARRDLLPHRRRRSEAHARPIGEDQSPGGGHRHPLHRVRSRPEARRGQLSRRSGPAERRPLRLRRHLEAPCRHAGKAGRNDILSHCSRHAPRRANMASRGA